MPGGARLTLNGAVLPNGHGSAAIAGPPATSAPSSSRLPWTTAEDGQEGLGTWEGFASSLFDFFVADACSSSCFFCGLLLVSFDALEIDRGYFPNHFLDWFVNGPLFRSGIMCN
jgi:hypothetical protein